MSNSYKNTYLIVGIRGKIRGFTWEKVGRRLMKKYGIGKPLKIQGFRENEKNLRPTFGKKRLKKRGVWDKMNKTNVRNTVVIPYL